MFGDILVWVVTFFGLVPWEKLFGRKKDFQEQLAELSNEPNVFFRDDIDKPGNDVYVGLGRESGSQVYPREYTPGSTERVSGPWGVVPNKCRDERETQLAIVEALCPPYTTRHGRRL